METETITQEARIYRDKTFVKKAYVDLDINNNLEPVKLTYNKVDFYYTGNKGMFWQFGILKFEFVSRTAKELKVWASQAGLMLQEA
jgi:hypothetical protein